MLPAERTAVQRQFDFALRNLELARTGQMSPANARVQLRVSIMILERLRESHKLDVAHEIGRQLIWKQIMDYLEDQGWIGKL